MFTQVGVAHKTQPLMCILMLSALGLPDVMALEVGMVAAPSVHRSMCWWHHRALHCDWSGFSLEA